MLLRSGRIYCAHDRARHIAARGTSKPLAHGTPLDSVAGRRRDPHSCDDHRRRCRGRPLPSAGPAGVAPLLAAERDPRLGHRRQFLARRLSRTRATCVRRGANQRRRHPAAGGSFRRQSLRPYEPVEPVAHGARLQSHVRGHTGHGARRRTAHSRPDRRTVLDACHRGAASSRRLLLAGIAHARPWHRARGAGHDHRR